MTIPRKNIVTDYFLGYQEQDKETPTPVIMPTPASTGTPSPTPVMTAKPTFPAGLYYIIPEADHPGGKIQILNGTMPRAVEFIGGQGFDVSSDFIITTEYDARHQLSSLVLWKADGTTRWVNIQGLYGVTRPSLSPDGKRVAVQATETAFSSPASTPVFFSIYIIDISTAQWTNLVPLSSNPNAGNGLPKWFPTGDRILYHGIEYVQQKGAQTGGDIIGVYNVSPPSPALTIRCNGTTGLYQSVNGRRRGPHFHTSVGMDGSLILVVGQMQIYDSRTGAFVLDVHQKVLDSLAAAGYQPDTRYPGRGDGGTFPLDGTLSPDNKTIIFDGAVQKNGVYGVLLMSINTDGTGFKIIQGPVQGYSQISNNHTYSQINPNWKYEQSSLKTSP